MARCLICGSVSRVFRHHFWHDVKGKGIDHAPELCTLYRVTVAYVYLCEPCHNKYEGMPIDFFLNKFKRAESMFMSENFIQDDEQSNEEPTLSVPRLIPEDCNKIKIPPIHVEYIKPYFTLCISCGKDFIPSDYLINTFCVEFCGSWRGHIQRLKQMDGYDFRYITGYDTNRI